MSNLLINTFVEKESRDIHFLFSYGSNSSIQVKERINSEINIDYYPAYIKNYVRIFAGVSKRWNGGIASIVPSEDNNVYGIVLKLTNAQLVKLDAFEGGYTREKINIYLQSIMGKERIVEGFVYVKNDNKFSHLPSQAYMEAIRHMLDERRISHSQKIVIRCRLPVTLSSHSYQESCVKEGIIKSIGIWDPEYGIKLYNI
jgi:hypothetical protein